MSVLFIDCCARENSRTRLLAQYFLDHFHDRDVTRVNPYEEKLYGLDAEMLKTRDEALAKGNLSHPVLGYAVQFAEADTIVIAAPYWDLSFPASLKNYIERINAVGVTFAYDESGSPYGMCRAKQLVYICTAGGPLISDAYGYGYVKMLCDTFWQIPETVHFYAENLDMPFVNVDRALDEVRKEMDLFPAEHK